MPNGTRHRATRADVARLANVSVASVSYALNNIPNKVSHKPRNAYARPHRCSTTVQARSHAP